ncbi:hypothetical protein ACFL6U_25715 [Planctomycetota bacterium]
MLRHVHLGFLVLVVSLATLVPGTFAQPWQEFPISINDDNAMYPDVDGQYVVWEALNKQFGDRDVFVADISNLDDIKSYVILGGSGDERYPKVSSGIIVCQRKEDGAPDWDVVALDLWYPQFGFFTIANTEADESRPDISQNQVVYEQRPKGSNWNIFMTDVWSENLDTRALAASTEDEATPVISENMVIWRAGQAHYTESYCDGAEVSDPNAIQNFITYMSLGLYAMPAVSKEWLVTLDPDGILKADNLFDPFPPIVITTKDAQNPSNPAISRNIIVFDDERNGNRDIFAYNLATGVEFQITKNSANQTHPAIYGDVDNGRFIVVWQDRRHDNSDIYGAVLTGPLVAGCVSPPRQDINGDCIVDFRDFALLAENWLRSESITSK